jgi:tellurite resistance-related uncharacterized protein
LALIRSSPEWNEHTIPSGLLRDHRIAAGTWGQVAVRQGHVRFTCRTFSEMDVVIGPNSTQAIPPEIEHAVHPLGPVCFAVHFFSIPQHDAGAAATERTGPERHMHDVTTQDAPEGGGDAA